MRCVVLWTLLLTACTHQDDAALFPHAGPSVNGAVGQRFTFDGSETQARDLSWRLVELIEGSSLRLRGVFSSENRNNLLSRRNGPIDMRYARLFYVLQKD